MLHFQSPAQHEVDIFSHVMKYCLISVKETRVRKTTKHLSIISYFNWSKDVKANV
jgi:hypothetical protein